MNVMIIPNIWKNNIHVPHHQAVFLGLDPKISERKIAIRPKNCYPKGVVQTSQAGTIVIGCGPQLCYHKSARNISKSHEKSSFFLG